MQHQRASSEFNDDDDDGDVNNLQRLELVGETLLVRCVFRKKSAAQDMKASASGPQRRYL